MPKSIVSCQYEGKTVTVENSWFHGMSLFIDDELVGKNNALSSNKGFGSFITVKYEFPYGEKTIDIFYNDTNKVQIKICIGGQMVGGSYFKTYMPRRVERWEKYVEEFGKKIKWYYRMPVVIVWVIVWVWFIFKADIFANMEYTTAIFAYVLMMSIRSIIELVQALIAVIIKRFNPELMDKILGEPVEYEETLY